MVVTIETSSEQELERLLEALQKFEITDVKVKSLEEEKISRQRSYIIKGNGTDSFFNIEKLWKDDDRPLELMRKNAWNRNETY